MLVCLLYLSIAFITECDVFPAKAFTSSDSEFFRFFTEFGKMVLTISELLAYCPIVLSPSTSLISSEGFPLSESKDFSKTAYYPHYLFTLLSIVTAFRFSQNRYGIITLFRLSSFTSLKSVFQGNNCDVELS